MPPQQQERGTSLSGLDAGMLDQLAALQTRRAPRCSTVSLQTELAVPSLVVFSGGTAFNSVAGAAAAHASNVLRHGLQQRQPAAPGAASMHAAAALHAAMHNHRAAAPASLLLLCRRPAAQADDARGARAARQRRRRQHC